MQTELKSKTLMQIAIAMGLLTVSIVALSLTDSAALTKAMAAMAVGLGQLVGVMALLDVIASGPKGAAKFAVLGASLMLIAGAMILLSIAIAILSKLSWEELAKGLVGVGGALVIIAGAMKLMPANMPLTAAGLVLVGIALNAIALAVKQFSDMSWGEMG